MVFRQAANLDYSQEFRAVTVREWSRHDLPLPNGRGSENTLLAVVPVP